MIWRREGAGVRIVLPFCILLGCLTGLIGCSSLRVEPPVIVRGLPPDEAVSDPARTGEIATHNQAAVQYYRDVEWPLQTDPDRPPQLGIALSGGGMRSAVFSLGVLSGLHDLKVFPQHTDVLSAVSGGGYIASWFYAQQVLNGCSADALLNADGDAQNYLKAHGDFVEIKPRHPGSYFVVASTLFPGGLLNLFANGVFGWHVNTPTTTPYYIYRFQKTFFAGARPCDFNGKNEEARSVSWEEIRKRIERANSNHDPADHIPNFILNSTVSFGYADSDVAHHGFNTVYEATPQRFGSEGMGYYCYPDKTGTSAPPPPGCVGWRPELGPLERIAMTSGAALDTSVIPGRLERLLASAFNFDLGHFFPNPHADPYPAWHLAIPLFYSFTPQYQLDSRGRRMLLSDGGHSENLGVYALARRAPATIVVVDAEQDPKHTFDAYRTLQTMLLHDLDLVLSVPAIDDAKDGADAVYYGSIRSVPRSGIEVSSTQVVYIKLPAQSFVKSECGKKPDSSIPSSVCCYLKGNGKFPFDSTFGDQSYDPDQFAAYRDLGLWVVERSKVELVTRLLRATP